MSQENPAPPLSSDRVQLCRRMRWKGCHDMRQSPRAVAAAFMRTEVPYTCLETFQHRGPDGRPVAPELCCEKRGCFEDFYKARTLS